MLSLGTPMILGEDEIARTQGGNNNAYCQDNEISWYNWQLLEKNSSLFRYIKEIIAFRKRHTGFMRPEFYTGRDGNYNAIPDISWFTKDGETPDWDEHEHCLAFRLDGSRAEIMSDRDDNDFFIMLNADVKKNTFKVAEPLNGKIWVRVIDTGLESPDDILLPGNEESLRSPDRYVLKDKSMVVLVSKMLY